MAAVRGSSELSVGDWVLPPPVSALLVPNPAHNTYTLKCEEPLKMMHLNIFRYFSFLLEWNVWSTKERLADFLGTFDLCNLEEPFGRVFQEPGKIRCST